MRRLLLALAAGAALGGCNFLIDPDSVPRPPDGTPAVCTPSGCGGVTCGYVDCGTVCQVGSGCLVTHRVTGGFSAGAAQQVVPATGHYVSTGRVAGSTSQPSAAPGGHRVTDGNVH